jgi:hypothetical protein
MTQLDGSCHGQLARTPSLRFGGACKLPVTPVVQLHLEERDAGFCPATPSQTCQVNALFKQGESAIDEWRIPFPRG